MNNLCGLLIVIAIVILLIFRNRSEKFQCKHYNPGDISHCPRACTPFLYPDMYSPHPSCSDPLNWGFTYSTGRCPHPYKPYPRRFPSAAKEQFDDNDGPGFTHGGGARYDEPKYTTSTGYGYGYGYS
ncbi:hypothetical protein LCGC14_2834810 [marine sediment metagenome]|uniref:Uncharacterized protein n=2 Tax=root TaxID=1 RepID=A0A0F8YD39_9ZZZZ|nr:MAG: hypothetical protein LCMAC202_05270 [Marseillevirus LCMAC202]